MTMRDLDLHVIGKARFIVLNTLPVHVVGAMNILDPNPVRNLFSRGSDPGLKVSV